MSGAGRQVGSAVDVMNNMANKRALTGFIATPNEALQIRWN